MTIFLILIIVFCFGLIGFKLASYYFLRKKFFSSLSLLLSSIEIDVNFSQNKMQNILSKQIETIQSNELKTICDNVCKCFSKKENVDYRIFDGITILKKDEKEFIYNIFSNIGRFDATSQSKEIKSFSSKVAEMYDLAFCDCQKYGSLFIKLGIIVGLFVCLLII